VPSKKRNDYRLCSDEMRNRHPIFMKYSLWETGRRWKTGFHLCFIFLSSTSLIFQLHTCRPMYWNFVQLASDGRSLTAPWGPCSRGSATPGVLDAGPRGCTKPEVEDWVTLCRSTEYGGNSQCTASWYLIFLFVCLFVCLLMRWQAIWFQAHARCNLFNCIVICSWFSPD